MLVERGDKRYTLVAKLKHWREFQRQVTVAAKRQEEATEDGPEAAEAADSLMEIGANYLNEHLSAVHVKGDDGEWVADEAWTGSADDYLEPDEAMFLIAKCANPEQSPFA